MPTKSKKGASRASSPVEELEENEPADAEPEVDPEHEDQRQKKKKNKKSTGHAAETAVAQPPRKKSKKKHVEEDPSPEDEEEEDEADDAGETVDEIDYPAMRQWVKEFRSQNRRHPYPSEFVELVGGDEALAKKVHKKLKAEADALVNKKKSKKIRGYDALARQAGYGINKDSTGRMDRGTDMLHPLVSMADAVRLATFVPLTPDAVTINTDEFQAHMELCKTTLAQSVAREITVNVDPMFRYCMNAAGKAQIAQGGTKITPATMMQVLKPMVDHLAFPSALSPPGLIKYSKDEAPPARKDYGSGEKGLAEWKKAVKSFNKRVKYADRGVGVLEVDAEDEDEVKLTKDNAEDAAANGKFHAAVTKKIEADRAQAKEKRDKANAAKA